MQTAQSAPRYLKRYTDQTGEAMKPVLRQAMTMTAAVSLSLAACAPAPQQVADGDAPEDTVRGWSRTPQINQVERKGGDLVFTGVAESRTRVVLRNDADAAFAAVADSEGRFEIRMTAPHDVLWLRPETQLGQTSAVSPDLLVIISGEPGAIVVLRPGTATRRLDIASGGGPVLDAVDSDGRIRLVSGRTAVRTLTQEIRVDGAPMTVTPDAQGRWSAVLAPESGLQTVSFDKQVYIWPGEGAPTNVRSIERAGDGWRIFWPLAGGHQTVWLPDRARTSPLTRR